jgi:hypothetical protein
LRSHTFRERQFRSHSVRKQLKLGELDIFRLIQNNLVPGGASSYSHSKDTNALSWSLIPKSDWMHDTARCLRHPSDSSWAAREWARETFRGRRPAQPPQPRLHPSSAPPSLHPVACAAGRGAPRPGLSLSSANGPGPLVWPEPVAPPTSSQYSASVRGGPPTSLLSPLAGIGHCPLAIGHGPSAGLLVSVLDRRPISPLSSPRACSGAGPGWHGCGWIAVSAVLSEGPAPWRWAPLVLCPLGRHRGGRSPLASGARLRRSRGHRAGRGQSAGPSSPAGVRLISGGQSLSGLRPLGSS